MCVEPSVGLLTNALLPECTDCLGLEVTAPRGTRELCGQGSTGLTAAPGSWPLLGSCGARDHHFSTGRRLACPCSAPFRPLPDSWALPLGLQSSLSPWPLEVPLFPFLHESPPRRDLLATCPLLRNVGVEALSRLQPLPCCYLSHVPLRSGRCPPPRGTGHPEHPSGHGGGSRPVDSAQQSPQPPGERGSWGRVPRRIRSSVGGENGATVEKRPLVGTAAPLSPCPHTRHPAARHFQGKENFDVSGLELVLAVASQSQLWPQTERPPSVAKPGTRVFGATSAGTCL